MNFYDYAQQVLDLREKEGVRAIDSERLRFEKHLAPWSCAKLDISEIRPKHVAELVRQASRAVCDDARGYRTLSSQTVKRIKQLASAVFDRAVEDGLADSNPCRGVKVRAKDHRTEEPWTWLTLDEQRAIEACPNIPDEGKDLVLFAIGSGLRQGEQWNLEMSDVSKDSVRVRFGSRGLPPKNGKIRTIPLFGLARRALEHWLSVRPNCASSLVFPTVTGCRRVPGAPAGYDGWMRAAGIERHVRWHDLRHTCASSLISGAWGHRWELADIRDYLGHSSISVTEKYSHLGLTGMRLAAEKTT